MSFLNAFRGTRVISVYHNPALEASKKAVQILTAATTGPYPPNDRKNPPLNFKLDVEEDPPTGEQMQTIREYLDPDSPRPGPTTYPIVVDWFGGKAYVGKNLDGVTKMLEELRQERDASFSHKAKSWKFW